MASRALHRLHSGGLAAEESGETRAASRPLFPPPNSLVTKELCVELVIGINKLNNSGAASHCSPLRSPLGVLVAEESGDVEESLK